MGSLVLPRSGPVLVYGKGGCCTREELWCTVTGMGVTAEPDSVYGSGVGRPKSADPTVPLTVRVPRSVFDWWTARAEKDGVSVRLLVQRLLIDRARKDTDG